MTDPVNNNTRWYVVAIMCVVLGVVGYICLQKKTPDTNEPVEKVKSSDSSSKQASVRKTEKENTDRFVSSSNSQKEEMRAQMLQIMNEQKMQEEAQNKKKLETEERMGRAIADKNWQEAVQLAGQLPEGKGKNRTLQSIAFMWTREDSAEAIKWANQLPEGEGRHETLAGIVNALMSLQNREEAMRLANQIPEGESRQQALVSIAITWAAKDPAAASQWVSGLPAGESRDKTITSVVNILAFQDREAATQLANQLSNEKQRNTVLDNLTKIDTVLGNIKKSN